MLPTDSVLLKHHPYKEDYEKILQEALRIGREPCITWHGILPFAVVLDIQGMVGTIGDPVHLTPGVIGIKQWLHNAILKQKMNCRAVGIFQMCTIEKYPLLQAELEHANGVPLCAFYPLPLSEHWWVTTHNGKIWSRS